MSLSCDEEDYVNLLIIIGETGFALQDGIPKALSSHVHVIKKIR